MNRFVLYYMTLSKYLIFMSVATTLCWAVFGVVVNIVDPFMTNWIGFVLFYTSLFLSIAGTASLIGFLMRFVVLRQGLVFYAVNSAFRQSFLIAILLVSALILMSINMLSWSNLLLLVLALSILEYLMLSSRPRKSHESFKSEIPEIHEEQNENNDLSEFINSN